MREEMCRQTEGWLRPGFQVGGLGREKDDPVCRLFTVRKKPAIKVDENGGK